MTICVASVSLIFRKSDGDAPNSARRPKRDEPAAFHSEQLGLQSSRMGAGVGLPHRPCVFVDGWASLPVPRWREGQGRGHGSPNDRRSRCVSGHCARVRSAADSWQLSGGSFWTWPHERRARVGTEAPLGGPPSLRPETARDEIRQARPSSRVESSSGWKGASLKPSGTGEPHAASPARSGHDCSTRDQQRRAGRP